MVPKLHAKGRSFRGAAAYLLHDKGRAKSAERVQWSETRNLATDDPHIAWRIMAATAMDRARLKAKAGVKNTGRKSDESVLHLTLSWHPDEKAGLSRDEMVRAGLGALRALGAEDRQTLIVCHNDEPQPHLHLLINRVSAEDGRMLSSSKEKLALSRWAEAYEKERGQVLCEERVLNNAARKRGEYVRGEADTPRHLHELEAKHASKPGIGEVKKQQRTSDGSLARERRQRAERRRKAWAEIAKRQKETLAEVRRRYRRETEQARQTLRAEYKPQWSALLRTQHEQVQAFEANEEKFLGRMSNTLSAIDFRSIMRAGTRRRGLAQVFDAIASKGARLQALKRVHEKMQRALLARQRKEERRVGKELRGQRDQEIADRRNAFIAERSSLVLTHNMEDAAHRKEWPKRSDERQAAYEKHRGQQEDAKGTEADQLLERMKHRRENREDRGNRPRRGW